MEIPETVSVRRFRDFNARQKQQLYETLVEMTEAIDELPKKSLRRTLELTLAVLAHKGKQVETLQKTLDKSGKDTQSDRRLNDENEKLQRMLEKLEEEKETYKDKIKGLTDEVFQLQKRLQEAAQQAEGSDKDSSDPLSELDKQEELLRNINTKNKHIKRLLRDIDALQKQNIEQSKIINSNEGDLKDIKEKMLQLSADITLVDNDRKALKQREHDLKTEITRLENNVTYLEEEREKTQREIKLFVEKYEKKKQAWKRLLDEKDRELKRLRGSDEKTQLSSSSSSSETPSSANTRKSSNADEKTKLRQLVETRDKQIEQLETKVKSLTDEMVTSTRLMNKVSEERKAALDPQKPRVCCKLIEERLRIANERVQQLSELLEHAEEDNVTKSKQALQAKNALEAYKRGDDGLVPALQKCASLERKLAVREKEIRDYISELNSKDEIMQENMELRKRLKIPDDVVVIAKNFSAKQRNKDKIIERLTLKLRSSEEMRLQLKLEKTQLRKEILMLEKRQMRKTRSSETPSLDALSLPSEIGEIPESVAQEQVPKDPLSPHMCGQCRGQGDGAASTELQTKYEEVLAENETLRIGMYEILDRLREYDASSDHITIDTELLQKLIAILPNRSASHEVTPKRLQNELNELKAREQALSELLRQNQSLETDESETGELSSVQSLRNIPEIPKEDEIIDSSTRPTTPNKDLDPETKIPVIKDDTTVSLQEYQDLQQQVVELQIYRKHYDELKKNLTANDSKLKQINHDLTDQIVKLELSSQQQSNSYAYMRVDYDKLLNRTRQLELSYINDTADLKRQLVEQQHELNRLSALQTIFEDRWKYSEDEFQQLEQRNVTLSMQLAFVIEEVLSGRVSDFTLEPAQDICLEYGVIKENYHLDFLPAAEYEQQRTELQTWREKQEELQHKNKELEGLLEIANGQVQSQQRLLNEITDNHINLRHLVADLQSTTEEKLLLAKIQRDLDSAKLECTRIEIERSALEVIVTKLKTQLKEAELSSEQTEKEFQNERKNKDLKIKFLQKSLFILKEKYVKFTPLIFLTNFVFAYTKFMRKLEERQSNDSSLLTDTMQQKISDLIKAELNGNDIHKRDDSGQIIKLIKAETQTKLLEESYQNLQAKYTQLQNELTEVRLRHATETEHWQTIDALFNDDHEIPTKPTVAEIKEPPSLKSEGSNTITTPLMDVATNTDEFITTVIAPKPAARNITPTRRASVQYVDKQTSPIHTPKPSVTPTKTGSPKKSNQEIGTQTMEQQIVEKPPSPRRVQDVSERAVQTNDLTTLSNQAVQTTPTKAQNDESKTKLKEMQQELRKAKERLAEVESLSELALSETSKSEVLDAPKSQEATEVERTILTFHSVLMEKDNSIQKYQDLLQAEREQNQSSLVNLKSENESLKSTVNNLNFNIKTKDIEILQLKANLEVLSLRRIKKSRQTTTAEGAVGGIDSDESGAENSLNELTDEKLEEMFEDTDSLDKNAVADIVDYKANDGEKEKQDTEELKEVPTLQKQIKELKDKITYSEQVLQAKEEEINILKEKLKLCKERESSLEGGTNPEIDQLRLLMEEKDKHINDLMETLKSFHDDQQRYINDSSDYSADQITKLAVDLNRTEATNKIYHTQVEALRRQLASLAQREKQARELNQSLRSQLIKRPVVSIKTELNARVKNENLQKRLQQLEMELDDSKAQLKRQEALLEAKRARSANEIGLWEKQKRWQQSAEKFKAKLEETETALEKCRSLLQAARNTITRLEKDKHVLELKLGRPQQHPHVQQDPHHSLHGPMRGSGHMKCCRTPSCPNLQHVGTKFTSSPSESPETYTTGPSSECSTPVRHAAPTYFDRNQPELIEALKARIELQQRKILAMELEGKGSNALTTELEKYQERCQMVDAQNLRLESKNLELQLENDVLKQSDASERLHKRIKHLEDYIIALKEEIARLHSDREYSKATVNKTSSQHSQSAEQTILMLRSLVEKLRSENRFLKEGGRRSADSRAHSESRTHSESPSANDFQRIQQMYTDAMEKIRVLQEELGVKAKCHTCGSRGKDAANEELKYIKEQLIKKTQLLQKAKVLLTRAAAKEKVLKEQLMMWKRKCSELQNVPVIDEISE